MPKKIDKAIMKNIHNYYPILRLELMEQGKKLTLDRLKEWTAENLSKDAIGHVALANLKKKLEERLKSVNYNPKYDAEYLDSPIKPWQVAFASYNDEAENNPAIDWHDPDQNELLFYLGRFNTTLREAIWALRLRLHFARDRNGTQRMLWFMRHYAFRERSAQWFDYASYTDDLDILLAWKPWRGLNGLAAIYFTSVGRPSSLWDPIVYLNKCLAALKHEIVLSTNFYFVPWQGDS